MYDIDSDIGYYDSLNLDERMLAKIAYRWGQAEPQEKAQLFRLPYSSRKLYVSLDPEILAPLLENLNGSYRDEAIELIDSKLLSRTLEGGEADPNIRLLYIFESAQRLGTVISALIETNDVGRKSLFEKLKSKDRILEIIANSQAKKPIEAYQKYVAAPQFLPTLPESARQCCRCDKKYEVWQHLEVRDCPRHTIHIGCTGYCVCNDKGSVDKTNSGAPSTISSEDVPPFDMAQQLSAVQDLLRRRGIDPPAMAQ
ncbi:hypothetical protein PG987_001811 [Apiospora arundinis]